MLVASADTDTLTRIAARVRRGPAGRRADGPDERKLALEGLPAVTAVGDTPIVLDQETGRSPWSAAPAPWSRSARCSSSPARTPTPFWWRPPTALLSVDLSTGALTTVATVPAGTPARPRSGSAPACSAPGPAAAVQWRPAAATGSRPP